jgi:hypothetical protein
VLTDFLRQHHVCYRGRRLGQIAHLLFEKLYVFSYRAFGGTQRWPILEFGQCLTTECLAAPGDAFGRQIGILCKQPSILAATSMSVSFTGSHSYFN